VVSAPRTGAIAEAAVPKAAEAPVLAAIRDVQTNLPALRAVCGEREGRRITAVVCLGETLARALDIPPSANNRVTKINTPAVELLGLHWGSPEMLDCLGRCHARFLQAVGVSWARGFTAW
jgi:hypothetical protein